MTSGEHHRPFNILLAEDDSDDRSFFEKALKELPLNTRLTMVNNGEELMKYLFENSDKLPDCLFLDLSMPRKTGFECLSEIKGNKKLEKLLTVMFTTSFSQGADLEQNLIKTLTKMGAEDYIRKPSDFVLFKYAIHQTLIKIMGKNRSTVQ